MSTLTQAPLSTLIPRLFRDADATQAQLLRKLEQLSPQQREAFRSHTDYRSFYADAKDFHLAVSPETATLLYLLARSSRARHIVEFGTSFGISTLHLAAALRDNGGGRLISSEFESSKVTAARANMEAGGVADLVEIREGDALETLAQGLPDTVDLVLLDGAKPLYPRILDLLEPRLRAGALIVADNADWCPAYLERVRRAGGGYLSVPFGPEVEV
ncbi:MAG: O-methyltransferase, partial [Nevskiales bacterium]